MGENLDCSETDTIPLLDIERKTLPVFCPWCNRIAGVAKMDVLRLDKISPYYKACGKCQDFINEGMVFIRGGNSRYYKSSALYFRYLPGLALPLDWHFLKFA
jgi:hypothetical protein